MNDHAFMQRALELAARGRATASPNPMVGAVVVSEGVIVGEGYHHKAGEPHAEPIALDIAGERTKGATLYVTLEPCCHHGRTPPCTARILRAGIRRVVAAMQDPFPEVSGKGFEILRKSGIEVTVGVLERDARRLNEAWIKRVTTGLPWVTLKAAVTLDGKLATRTGDSKWITGEAAREEAHRLRSWHDVTLVGIGTVLADDPLLTCRLPGDHGRQGRAVLDSQGRLPITSQLVRTASPELPVYQFIAEETRPVPMGRHVISIPVPRTGDGLDLEIVLHHLAESGANSVLVEGGSRVLTSFLRSGHADQAAVFIAPIIVGDDAAPAFIGGSGPDRIADALRLREAVTRTFGGDVLMEGYLRKGTEERES